MLKIFLSSSSLRHATSNPSGSHETLDASVTSYQSKEGGLVDNTHDGAVDTILGALHLVAALGEATVKQFCSQVQKSQLVFILSRFNQFSLHALAVLT